MCLLCQLPTTHETEKVLIASYLDPGTGYVFQSLFPAVLGLLSTFFAGILFFFRKFFGRFLKKKILLIVLIVVIAIIAFIFMQNKQQNIGDKRVYILAFDGMDPNILSEGIKRNLLPNFKKLKESGFYSALGTTVPPQSPVAWASFTTGVSPAKHHVYDFIARNPQNYQLDLTFSKKNQLDAEPFWKELTKKNIPSTILFLPDTFPPTEMKGKMISGMGTPDALGTQGTSILITTKDYSNEKNWRGRIVSIVNDKEISTSMPGPKYKFFNETKTAEIPLEIKKTSSNKLTLTVQKQQITLKKEQFSNWVPITISIDFFTKLHTMVKFYAKEITPNIEIYVSPYNFDPENPIYPISYPRDFAKELAKKYGTFSTLGLPLDTWALDQNVFNDEAFLVHARQVTKERENIYFGELSNFKSGLFFGYFGLTDSISHMYWRFLNDPKSKYQSAIIDSYKDADMILGETMKKVRAQDLLVVLSDHGFNSFDYEMNLNTWLMKNGYLVLKKGKTIGGEMYSDVDWEKTRAYAAGYNGIYLNIKGREAQGSVPENKSKNLQIEMKKKLLALKNDATESNVVRTVYTRDELGIVESDTNAPELFVGFYKGIRSSWEGAVGAVEKDVIKKRESKWSGDHLFDPKEVPGVLLMNKKNTISNPNITDVMPMVMQFLGVSFVKNFDAKNVIEKNDDQHERTKEDLRSLGY